MNMPGMSGDGNGTYYHGHYVPTASEKTEYQSTREPWAGDVKYGFWGVEFACGSLALWAVGYLYWKVEWMTRIYSLPNPFSVFISPRLIAVFRLLTYPRLPHRFARTVEIVYTPGPLGPMLYLLVSLLFVSLLCWISPWYYRPRFYGSPPLGLRSEWLAMASLPFIYVLGSKRNLISSMTGISHDKLQVLHQGIALNFLYMSVVHTIAEMVRAFREYSWSYTYATNDLYWTGFLCLGPLVVLCVASIPPIRKRFYESFWIIHMAAALAFIGTLYYHVFNELNSNDYMNATIVLFCVGILARLFFMVYHNRPLHRATIEIFPSPSNAIRISVPTSSSFVWSPGQHVFLRFPRFRPLEAHPFTIASIPEEQGSMKANEMVFLVRPQDGFTKRLYDFALKHQSKKDNIVEEVGTAKLSLSVIVDGPYGQDQAYLRGFDEVLLCGGGAGVTYVLPLLLDLVRGMSDQKLGGESLCRRVKLVWSVRHRDAASWVEKELSKIPRFISGTVSILVHITDESLSEEDKTFGHPHHSSIQKIETSSSSGEEKVIKSENLDGLLKFQEGRADLKKVVRDFVVNRGVRYGVAVCGPSTFGEDVANAVTSIQTKILTRELKCEEVYLQSEAFGW